MRWCCGRVVAMPHVLLLPLVLCWLCQCVEPYRLVNPNGTAVAEFASYEQGFVGTYGDPTTTYYMETMMETGGDLRALTMQAACPGVLVPGDNGVLFCGAKERGVCDTRSGTCVCSDGYM
eukprot:TRINITY_DN7854_c0_g1_i1.p1 TRINITY_DN7854_c0_g1~~TRINITY_DN7854_c0_g1_i1.p1  ORF type:complete len:120 (+),score=37.45 TRINITY_DN7854_c0_g1_i1:103-462(+)